ncbi:expressed unknown protein [Seminavis robusta]|uniref:RING-type domain-containing protein n=1 Tax=Seminavis robusta TaxID=568900 RepID=A0A9N8F1J6_9STRA|nr:expressed unknown protein [Seminavis robusta]|eukprot:Sro3301_g346420.1 n/a (420) ;mRNA; f:1204-2463
MTSTSRTGTTSTPAAGTRLTQDPTTTITSGTTAAAPLGAQLDVSILDDYLHSLLLQQFLSSMDPLFAPSVVKHETLRTIRMILAALLPAATLWTTQLQTPGTKAVGLRTVMAGSSSVVATKVRYILVTALLPLGYQILQRWMVHLQEQQQQEDTTENEDTTTEQQRIGRQRKYHLIRNISKWVEHGLPICKLGLLLSLLWQPRQQQQSSSLPPRLSMILAGVSFMSAATASTTAASTDSSSPDLSTTSRHPRFYVLYAHRRWLMEESLQTVRLVFGPAMTSLREWRHVFYAQLQRFLRSWTPTRRHLSNTDDTNSLDVPCALCGKKPIAIPYETDGCSHVFCYVCLWSHVSKHNNTVSSSFRPFTTTTATVQGSPCPVCQQVIRSSRPVPLQRYRQAARAAANSRATTINSNSSNSHKS